MPRASRKLSYKYCKNTGAQIEAKADWAWTKKGDIFFIISSGSTSCGVGHAYHYHLLGPGGMRFTKGFPLGLLQQHFHKPVAQ